MKPSTRRQFLKWGLGTAIAGATAYSSFRLIPLLTSQRGIALGSGQYVDSSGQNRFVLSLLDLNHPENKPTWIPIHFRAHGITPHPHNPKIVTLFEKKGPGSCEVDLVEKKVTRKIETLPNRHFYGHTAYSKDADVLFSTEAFIEGHAGLIAIRDEKSMQIIDRFPSYGMNPHDCTLIDNGQTLVITNGGGSIDGGEKPNVSYVDVKSQKLLDQVSFDTKVINAGHLMLSSNRDLIIVSAPREGLPQSELGAISFRPYGKKIITATEPKEIVKKMVSETLSLALHEPSHTVAATNPTGNLVTFWNYKKGSFIHSIELKLPRSIGVTRDQKYYVIGHGEDASVAWVDAENFNIIHKLEIKQAGFSGSHLKVLDTNPV